MRGGARRRFPRRPLGGMAVQRTDGDCRMMPVQRPADPTRRRLMRRWPRSRSRRSSPPVPPVSRPPHRTDDVAFAAARDTGPDGSRSRCADRDTAAPDRRRAGRRAGRCPGHPPPCRPPATAGGPARGERTDRRGHLSRRRNVPVRCAGCGGCGDAGAALGGYQRSRHHGLFWSMALAPGTNAPPRTFPHLRRSRRPGR